MIVVYLTWSIIIKLIGKNLLSGILARENVQWIKIKLNQVQLINFLYLRYPIFLVTWPGQCILESEKNRYLILTGTRRSISLPTLKSDEKRNAWKYVSAVTGFNYPKDCREHPGFLGNSPFSQKAAFLTKTTISGEKAFFYPLQSASPTVTWYPQNH